MEGFPFFFSEASPVPLPLPPDPLPPVPLSSVPLPGGFLRECAALPTATWLLPGMVFLSPPLDFFAEVSFFSAFSSVASVDWSFFQSSLVSSSFAVLILLTVRVVRSTMRPSGILGVTERSLARMEAMRSALSLSTVDLVAFLILLLVSTATIWRRKTSIGCRIPFTAAAVSWWLRRVLPPSTVIAWSSIMASSSWKSNMRDAGIPLVFCVSGAPLAFWVVGPARGVT